MDYRTYGETRDCKGCRFWSEMIAKCDGGGPVVAMCLNSRSPNSSKYVAGSDKCVAWASGEYGAVDEPGSDPSVYEEVPAGIIKCECRNAPSTSNGIQSTRRKTMSADNQMVVLPWGGVWATYMHLGEYPYTHDEIKHALFFATFHTRESAINYASRVCEQEVVEYGLRILNDNPKKEGAC